MKSRKIKIVVELEVGGNGGEAVAEEVIRKAIVKASDTIRANPGIIRTGSVTSSEG